MHDYKGLSEIKESETQVNQIGKKEMIYFMSLKDIGMLKKRTNKFWK